MLIYIFAIHNTVTAKTLKTLNKMQAKVEVLKRNNEISLLYRVTKVLGDTDYVDIKMRVASSI